MSFLELPAFVFVLGVITGLAGARLMGTIISEGMIKYLDARELEIDEKMKELGYAEHIDRAQKK